MNGHQADVLVVGAGPTGLVLAVWLVHLGVRPRIIDKTDGPGTTSRAVAVQARTLEFYQQVGLAHAIIDRGRRAVGVNIWVEGRQKAHAPFGDLGTGLSPFPFALLLTQDEHERLLIDHLARLGVVVERQTAITQFHETADGVRAQITGPRGEESLDVRYIAGCDGGRSTVRETLGIGFAGGTYAHLFYVADIDGSGPAMNGEVHIDFEASDFLAIFPLRGDGRARLVGTVRQEADGPQQPLTWENVSQDVIRRMHIDVARVTWFSTYRVHHRVADHFRRGRAFLLGDAAHVHSPVGGQGMNTGIGDAINLSWKLAHVLRGRASAALLDSYEPERIAFARRLVATTDRAFTAVTSRSVLARALRMDIAPTVIPPLLGSARARHLLFRTVSQIGVQYRGGPLSVGRVGAVRGGDRLPWVAPVGADGDNFAPLTALDWQVHVYGATTPALRGLCDARGLPLHAFPWRPDVGHTGLTQDALYLVRPDGYIAVAAAAGTESTFGALLSTAMG